MQGILSCRRVDVWHQRKRWVKWESHWNDQRRRGNQIWKNRCFKPSAQCKESQDRCGSPRRPCWGKRQTKEPICGLMMRRRRLMRMRMINHLRNLSLGPRKSFSIAPSSFAVNCPRYVKPPVHHWKCLRPLIPGAQLLPPGEERHLRVKIR